MDPKPYSSERITCYHKKAFTLVEVLLATTIFAVAITALSQSLYNAVQSNLAIKHTSENDADKRFIREHILRIKARKEVEKGGTIEALSAGRTRWKAELFETQIVDLFRIEIQLDFTEARMDEEKMQLYVWRPEWSEAQEREILLKEKKQLFEAKHARRR